MKRLFLLSLALILTFALSQQALASSKGSPRRSNRVYGTAKAQNAQSVIDTHIQANLVDGFYHWDDPVTGKKRRLKYSGIKRPEHTLPNNMSTIIVAYRDVDTNDKVTILYNLRLRYGRKSIASASIYAVNGKKR